MSLAVRIHNEHSLYVSESELGAIKRRSKAFLRLNQLKSFNNVKETDKGFK